MNNKAITAISTLLIFIAAYCLFSLKREVEYLNLEIAELNRQSKNELKAINLLKAEFTYLTSPEHIRALAKTHLNLVNITPGQMITDPLRDGGASLTAASAAKSAKQILVKDDLFAAITKTNTKWRYKSKHNKYIQAALRR